MLTCVACGTDNPAGHRFCGRCGAALATTCPACGASAVPGFQFCGACGSPLNAAPVPPAAPDVAPHPVTERRVCSVLFADLVGFTPLSESRDPESVRELLSRYFDTARTVIDRYGGVVEKFIGDAVMAVWGTPVATEGDGERAVRAALDLVTAIAALGGEIGADGLALRAGVVTGEVAATLGAVGEGMVAGDAVNTAARVQSAAEPGTVWVDSATQRLAGAAVGFVSTGPHVLKGKAEPMELWQATRVLSSVGGVQRVDGLEAAMVGRDAEERLLRELFHACADRRAPMLVTISGAAGTGKSRLGWEFEKYVDGLAETTIWHRGRCLSYGDGIACWALAEAIRARLGIAVEDATDEAGEKFLAGLERWVPSADENRFVGVRLGRLLGLSHPDDTGAALVQDDLFAGWRLFLERMADAGPVVLLVEDAQYADDVLLDFIEHVVDRARRSPIYLVVLGRSELVEGRPSMAVGRSRTALTLDDLDDRSMRALVGSLVADLPDSSVTAILDQAHGNPMFAIETIRSLIDRDAIVPIEGEYRLVGDVGALSVPDSLHGLLAARLDALDPPLRVLVTDAAVLGTSFPADALTAVSGRSAADVLAALTELVHRDVFDVSTDPLSPQQGFYTFAQNMLRQVAYDTLSRRDRRARHLAVAEHLQRAFAGGGDEVMDVVARHYIDALAAVPDEVDEEVRSRAVASLVRAGERSERVGATLRAGRSFDEAAGLAADPPAAAGLWERAGHNLGLAAHHELALEAERRAREVYRSAHDARAAARTLARSARWLRMMHRTDEARAALDEAMPVLRDSPDADTVLALGELATLALETGDLAGRALADEALGLAQAVDAPAAQLATLLGVKGLSDIMSRRPVEGVMTLRHAAELAEGVGDRVGQARALNNLAATDPAAAATAARSACELFRFSGAWDGLDTATATLAFAQLCLGEWTSALAELDTVRTELDVELSWSGPIRAVLLALRGQRDAAVDAARLPRLRESRNVEAVPFVAWTDAVLAAASGEPRRASRHLRGAFAPDGDVDLTLEALIWSWPLAVRCALEIGDLDEARRLVTLIDGRPVGHLPSIVRSGRALARARLLAVGTHDGDRADGDRADGDRAAADSAFDDAVAELRSTASPYHLAHGLLDHADYLDAHGRDAAPQRDEATLISEQLQAVDLDRRIRVLGGVVVDR